jgi:hypothetical protein
LLPLDIVVSAGTSVEEVVAAVALDIQKVTLRFVSWTPTVVRWAAAETAAPSSVVEPRKLKYWPLACEDMQLEELFASEPKWYEGMSALDVAVHARKLGGFQQVWYPTPKQSVGDFVKTVGGLALTPQVFDG